jgi:hypothetical protein
VPGQHGNDQQQCHLDAKTEDGEAVPAPALLADG